MTNEITRRQFLSAGAAAARTESCLVSASRKPAAHFWPASYTTGAVRTIKSKCVGPGSYSTGLHRTVTRD